jgi:hypothetical protein
MLRLQNTPSRRFAGEHRGPPCGAGGLQRPATHLQRTPGRRRNATTAAPVGGKAAQETLQDAGRDAPPGGLRGRGGGRRAGSGRVYQPAHAAYGQYRDGCTRRLAGQGHRDGADGGGAGPRGQLAEPHAHRAARLRGQRRRHGVSFRKRLRPGDLKIPAEYAAHLLRSVVPHDDPELEDLVQLIALL